MSLNKEAIFAVKPKLAQIDIPEWGGSVYIRPLTLNEQAKLADRGEKFGKQSASSQLKNVMLPTIIWSVVDSDAVPVFDSADTDRLMETPASALLRVQDEILRFSGLTAAARADLEKNLSILPDSAPDSQ